MCSATIAYHQRIGQMRCDASRTRPPRDEADARRALARGAQVGLARAPGVGRPAISSTCGACSTPSARARARFRPRARLRRRGAGHDRRRGCARRDGTPVRSLYGASLRRPEPAREDLDGIDVSSSICRTSARGTTRSSGRPSSSCARARARRARARPRSAQPPRRRPGTHRREIAGRARICSFVGLEPIPVRHGLTLGEIVAWRAEVEGIPRELVRDPRRRRARPGRRTRRRGTGRSSLPSPNMPTYETALVYPGGCLLEGTNLSEGRGTTRPFEIVGAPWLDGARLARRSRTRSALPGFARARSRSGPRSTSTRGSVCGGVQIHVTDPSQFRPVRDVPGARRDRAARSAAKRSPSGPSATSSSTTCRPSIC